MLEREKLEEVQGLIVQKCARVLDTRPFYNVTGDLQELVDLITMIAAYQAAKAVYEMEDRRNITPFPLTPMRVGGEAINSLDADTAAAMGECSVCGRPFNCGDTVRVEGQPGRGVYTHAACIPRRAP